MRVRARRWVRILVYALMAGVLFRLAGLRWTYDRIGDAVGYFSYYPSGERILETLVDTNSLNPPWMPRLFHLEYASWYVFFGVAAWLAGIIAGCALLLWAVRRTMHLKMRAGGLLPVGVRCIDRAVRLGWWLPAATYCAWIVFERSVSYERTTALANRGVPVPMVGINDQPTFIVMMAGGMMLVHWLVLYHSLPCALRSSREFRRGVRVRCVGCGYDLGLNPGLKTARLDSCPECARTATPRSGGPIEPSRRLLRHAGTRRRFAFISAVRILAVALLTAPRSGTIVYEALPWFLRNRCRVVLGNAVYTCDWVLVRVFGPKRYRFPYSMEAIPESRFLAPIDCVSRGFEGASS
ncbi:MAG TPA: hypothetical protein PKU91_01065 [Phycisphaerales bacterium]|nr:hypothetical protein [Phycisphaerales bacterium]